MRLGMDFNIAIQSNWIGLTMTYGQNLSSYQL